MHIWSKSWFADKEVVEPPITGKLALPNLHVSTSYRQNTEKFDGWFPIVSQAISPVETTTLQPGLATLTSVAA